MTVDGTIVVGLDGSVHADRALDWAGRQASLERRPVTLVAVGHDAPAIVDAAAHTVATAYPSVTVRSEPGRGDPREVLLDASERAHLVVVGSRGMGAVRGLVLGSVSAAVADHAACPAVVCRPPLDRPTAGIVVGADGTPGSLPVVEFAFEQADLHGEPLTVLHGFWGASAAVAQQQLARGREVGEPDLESLRVVLGESVAGMRERFPDVRVDLVLKHGFAEDALSPPEDGWSLVVVGRHPGTAVSRLLQGSVTSSVVDRAHGPVAVVPEPDPRRGPATRP